MRSATAWPTALVAALLASLLVGCMLPAGTPVIVDRRGGDYWSGEGVLLETTADGADCRVAIRNDALFVEKRWVPCGTVHVRTLPRS